MAKLKMKYGIDLGTTNSAICRIENGEPVIKKTDSGKETLPSCVRFTEKKVIVGDKAYRQQSSDPDNTFIEFKRTMGLGTMYHSEKAGRDFSSEELSAEVLKTLKSFVNDDKIEAAVITIPAKFKAPEIAATMRAAKMAGIEHCALLQEPIAASLAYGLQTDIKNGYWLVFDFGGGTFDAALMHVEDGIIKVKDTDGNAYLGGKNLDNAIRDQIIIPVVEQDYTIEKCRTAFEKTVKQTAEDTKNQLSFHPTFTIETEDAGQYGQDDNGDDIDIETTVSSEMLSTVLTPLFQKAIDIVKELLKRNNLKGSDLSSLILVGGPTFSPILRQMLKEQVTPNVDTSIDPMTAVARGAALYATTQEYESETTAASTTSQQVVLDLDYQSTSVLSSEYIIVKLIPSESCGVDGMNLVFEVTSADGAWSSGRMALSAIGEAAECPLKEGRANAFSVAVFNEMGNRIPCTPNELTIIQGSQVGSATLPYNIGIEAYDSLMERNVFVPLKGLEKNQELPATGVRNGLKVPHTLNPGNEEDKMVIPIYQGEYHSEGSSAIYNDHVFDVVITGDDVPSVVPQNSEIDITLKVNNSQGYYIEVLFVSLGESFEKEISIGAKTVISYSDWLRQYNEALKELHQMKRGGKINASEFAETEKILADLDQRKETEGIKDDDREHLLADLRRAFLKLEEVEKKHEWDILEAELREEYANLEKANNDFGNKFDDHVREMHKLVENALRGQDIRTAREVKQECHALWVEAAMPGILATYVHHYDQNFGRLEWRDRMLARQLINEAQQLMNQNADVNEVRQVIINLIDLLPDNSRPDENVLPKK